MEKEKEDSLKKKSCKLSIKEGAAYSVSEGFGIRYIGPFALALGAKNIHISLLTSLPTLLGRFFQLHSIKLMSKISRKKICFYGALLQAISWLLIISIGALYFNFNITSEITPSLLVFVYTLLIIFGTFFVPAWSSWMRDLVTEETGHYFGKRSRIITFVSLVSMLIASFILDYFKQTKIFIGFVIIFSIAFLARLVSAFIFTKKYEPEFKQDKKHYFGFLQFIKQAYKNNFGKFVIYVALISLTTTISSPFFVVYQLENLKLSYLQYTLILIVNLLSTLIFIPAWGKFADKYGNLKVIIIAGFLIPIIPLLYLLTPYIHGQMLMPFLLIIEVISGFSWAGFNLSASNFVFDAVTREKMALCVSYFNIVDGLGTFIGATIGGIIASFDFVFFGFETLLFIFLLSGITRLFVSLLFIGKLKEVRKVRNFGLKEFRGKLSNLSIVNIINYLK
ncbi:MAG: MFS transporter [Candidatus Nanoarchaeia archaeon]